MGLSSLRMIYGVLWLPGLRHLSLDRAVYWFRPRRQQREIQLLAVFFGGQDHQRHMLVRLLEGPFQGS
jgi:hypothetical protein